MTQSMRKPDLTPEDRTSIFQILLQHSNKGKVLKGKIPEVATSFGVSVRTIQTLWATAKITMSKDQAVIFKSNKKGKLHKKTVFFDEEKFSELVKKTHQLLKSIRNVAKELEVSKTTVWRWKKDGVIVAHTNAVKPILTEHNKIERMQFCLSQIYYDEEKDKFMFHGMFNVIHIDEKKNYMKEEVERYYTLPNHDPELRTTQNKRYIEKIMFLSCVGRPHPTTLGNFEFDGKIGMWAFTHWVPAQRKSINRERGTLELKSIKAVTKKVTKEFMLTKVIPAIKSKWPPNASKRILIQWDNAPPHINNNDPEFRAAASSDGFDIQLYFQPPNSPYCNINYLGWFRCLETLQWNTRTYNLQNLVAIVEEVFEEVDGAKLNKVFLSLQQGMVEILKAKGCNGFKQPHMGKDALIRQGLLPESIEVDEALIRENIDHVIDAWDGEVPSYDFSDLMSTLGYDDEDP